jgi:hypothetical protein
MTTATQNGQVQSLVACGFSAREILEGRVAQPAIYLLQRAGYNPGHMCYRFTWEVGGPWSEHFASEHAHTDAWDLAGIHDEPPEELLTAAEMINPLLNPPARSLLDRYTWQQLVVAVDFLITYRQLPDDHDERNPFISKNFSAEQVEMAWLALKNSRLR